MKEEGTKRRNKLRRKVPSFINPGETNHLRGTGVDHDVKGGRRADEDSSTTRKVVLGDRTDQWNR